MNLRPLLLLGTSLGLLAFSPIVANAQSGPQAAYRAYAAAQKSGDKSKIDAARQAFEDACQSAGAKSLEDCMAIMKGGGKGRAEANGKDHGNAPGAEQGGRKAEEPAKGQPAGQPAPEAQPKAAKPQPEAKPAVEPAPKPQAEKPAAKPEAKPQPKPETAPKLEAVPKPEAAPKPEQPAPETQPAQPKAETAAPAEKPAAQPPAESAKAPAKPDNAKSEAAGAAAANAVKAAADAYNRAVAAYADAIDKKGDVEAARKQVGDARTRLADACAKAGTADIGACTRSLDISLSRLPANPAPSGTAKAPAQPGKPPAAQGANPPAAAKGEPTPGANAPQKAGAEEKPAPANQPAQNAQTAPGGQPVEANSQQPEQQPKAPAGQAAVPKEEIKQLPKGVKENQVAPLFDSAKDQGQPGQPSANASQPGQPGANANQPGDHRAPRQAGNGPSANGRLPGKPPVAPSSDANAQADIGPVKVPPVSKDQGKKIQAPPQLVLPQNVTIVQQGNAPGNQAPGFGRGDHIDRNGPGGGGSNGPNDHNGPNPPSSANPFNFQIILNIGGHDQIRDRRAEQQRLFDNQQDQVYYEDLGHGDTRETIERPDGSRLVTIRNRFGDILRRSRITPDGHEYVLAYVDPRDQQRVDSYTDPGADLPPLQLDIPAQDYVMDARSERASRIASFLDQPPVEPIRRIYSIDEVKHSARLRDDVRRLEISDLTFASGSAELSIDQVGTLDNVAQAMQDLLRNNPAETFLIEGHTDAVGSDIDNLQLSDARAASVAEVLTDHYGIPPENLVTQGYGERFLRIQTDGPEPLNRRVVVRRITPLVTPVAGR